jgi:hypothetical protein
MPSFAEKIVVSAENGYSAPILIEDLEQYRYILAYRVNGELLGTEDAPARLGSMIIAVDFTDIAPTDTEIYKHQLVWQVNQIRVE